jgi:hypothetical protein
MKLLDGYNREAETGSFIGLSDQKNKIIWNVNRMEDIRYPKQLLDYRPIGRRRPGRPLKGQLDGYSSEAETGHLLA